MILKDGTKHACRSCITGHRSSKCVHHDRELFPIAKKGRPSTQCKACKQRGTHNGRCECQAKRKPKTKLSDGVAADGFGQGSYPPESSTSRQNSGDSQASGFPAPDDGNCARMLAYPQGVEGSSTRATNSSASSPSYAQQTFAINHPSLDPNLAGGGLPIPQSESTFAYGVPSAGHGHSEHLELPQPRPMTGPGRSRPVTAGEEEVPWWLYRAGYSPNPGLPYEPPGQSAHMHGTPGVYSDYGHFMSQSSPYLLGTPGTNTQASPAFVWHNNATSYRDYMATQQMNNYQPVPSGHAPASHTLRGHEQQHQPPVPSLHHHHSYPYLHAATAISGPTSNAHSAPGSAHVASQSGSQQPHRHDPSWGSMSMESSNSGHYALTSNGQEHSRARNSYSQGVGHQHQAESNTDGVPALGYDSGSSRMTSTESITSLNHLPTPVYIGTASAAATVADHHHYKGKSYSQSDLPSQDPSLRGRRSTSFDQVVNRASPINLRLPEDRKKRKFDSES